MLITELAERTQRSAKILEAEDRRAALRSCLQACTTTPGWAGDAASEPDINADAGAHHTWQ